MVQAHIRHAIVSQQHTINRDYFSMSVIQICVSGYTFSRRLKEHVRAAHCVNTTGQQTC